MATLKKRVSDQESRVAKTRSRVIHHAKRGRRAPVLRRLLARQRATLRKLRASRDRAEARKRSAGPKITPRSEWGGGSQTADRHTLGKNSRPIVHHTASAYGLNSNSSIAQEKATMRAIDSHHTSNGWRGIGYSFVIFPSGNIYEGRGFDRAPAAAAGHNTGHFHPSLVGNFENQQPTKAALAALEALTDEFRRRSGSSRPAVGHRDVNPTSCPGKNLYPHVRSL